MALTPKKSLGQHWLHDKKSLEAIINAADIQDGDTVLEIGPGLGTLTSRLLRRGASVIAVEFDHDLAVTLPKNLIKRESLSPEQLTSLTVVESDILQFDLRTLPENFHVVANIPYYLTSNLIRVLHESVNPFSRAAILIQKEVAERACAVPGQMSLLSVSTQYYSEASLGILVPSSLFNPPPKVDSQVLRLVRRTQPIFPDVDHKLFFRIVRAGFSQKRKTLGNSISAGLRLSKQAGSELLVIAGIDQSLRAQSLGLEDWYRLYTAYNQMGSGKG